MMPWSDEQQKLLRAMGYVLYAQASASATSSIKAAESTTPELGRLLQALRQAANGDDVSALVADIAALRGDAHAKRALWPKLRALRRPH